MPGWEHFDYVLLLIAVALLPASAFFSGSETALFGLSESQRLNLRRSHAFVAAAVDRLLAEPRLLLITILLGNMLVNVTYFVISSVLLMQAEAGVVGEIAMAVATLILIVVFGEVIPKIIANSRRTWFAVLTATPLFLLHRLVTPLVIVLEKFVVGPLSRLTAPQRLPRGLSTSDLEKLLVLSSEQGVIDADEQLTLREVIHLSQLKVRDVMTPRVSVHALAVTGSPAEIREVAMKTGYQRLPVYEGDLDHIIGILDVRRWLIRAEGGSSATGEQPFDLRRMLSPAKYVPENASVDQLLEHFRRTSQPLAVVIDEYGGTSGIVSYNDVIEEIVGDLAPSEEDEAPTVMLIGPDTWRIRGDMPLHDWGEAFGVDVSGKRQFSTIGGLVLNCLGREPQQGDELRIGNLSIRIEETKGRRVVSIVQSGSGYPERSSATGEGVLESRRREPVNDGKESMDDDAAEGGQQP